MNDEDVLGAFLLVNNPIVLSEEETKDVQKAIKKLQQEMKKVTIQQKEFIKWLEDYINLFDKKDIYEEGSCDMLEEILQKYKSIIGYKDEQN